MGRPAVKWDAESSRILGAFRKQLGAHLGDKNRPHAGRNIAANSQLYGGNPPLGWAIL
jgi:hypothetical protein